MADVLNLVPKKDIFEGIMNRSINEISIDATPYWRKRLIDQGTNNFKDFSVVRLSCGSPEKFDFVIDEFDLRDNQIIVKLQFEDEEKEEDVEKEREVIVERLEENKKIIETITKETTKTTFQIPVESPKPEVKKETLKERVNEIIKEFLERKNVFVVPTDVVTIRTNGQIVGTSKRLVVDKDLDTVFELGTDDFVLYKEMTDDDFINYFKSSLNKYYSGNYVFICMKKSGWVKWASGEDALRVRIACRKTYLMGRR